MMPTLLVAPRGVFRAGGPCVASRRWTGLHGSYMTDSTLEAVSVESVRRVVARKAASALVGPSAGQDADDRDDELSAVALEAHAIVADAEAVFV